MPVSHTLDDEARVEAARKQLGADYRETFGSEGGRRVLKDLLMRFNVGSPVHVPGDPCETAYRDGSRFVVLTILDMIKPETDTTSDAVLREYENPSPSV